MQTDPEFDPEAFLKSFSEQDLLTLHSLGKAMNTFTPFDEAVERHLTKGDDE